MELAILVWTIIAAIGAAVGAAHGVYAFAQDRREKKRQRQRLEQLKIPCEVHFLITRKEQGTLPYVAQDSREHQVDELVLPSNATVPIGLWIRPRLEFRHSDFYFGCEGPLEVKPQAISYLNPLVARGIAKENTPEEDRHHYVDIHGFYHIVDDRVKIPTEVYVTGFQLQTKGSGLYEAWAHFQTTEVRGQAKLLIRVEDQPVTKMKCIGHEGCYLEPLVESIPNS